MQLYLMSVGHALSAVVELSERLFILYDCGLQGHASSSNPALEFLSERIDGDCEIYAFVSHLDLDHINGFEDLRSDKFKKVRRAIRGFFCNKLLETTVIRAALATEAGLRRSIVGSPLARTYRSLWALTQLLALENQILAEQGAPFEPALLGKTLDSGKLSARFVASCKREGVDPKIWGPTESRLATATDLTFVDATTSTPSDVLGAIARGLPASNDTSIVLQLIGRSDERILLLGDATGEELEEALDSGLVQADLQSDVIVASHHGASLSRGIESEDTRILQGLARSGSIDGGGLVLVSNGSRGVSTSRTRCHPHPSVVSACRSLNLSIRCTAVPKQIESPTKTQIDKVDSDLLRYLGSRVQSVSMSGDDSAQGSECNGSIRCGLSSSGVKITTVGTGHGQHGCCQT
ncbi:hypothetical protein [Engelhardtia mirabilis]|uniref:Metallo-beta-lactamase domain-containing protein n=1 Tax=Engelhardtia mirabilis TaxID=2528011 RepID=A0A518BJU7_9BACT|nr:hypothetical protein Pla133_23240 [Planctomycetes bacterium Pla133]QDV01573.1 hypothetical protein Pla86_23240 [Planctomycetes bacterium Pla86]